MRKKTALLTRIKASAPVRGFAKRALRAMDAREQKGAGAWHRPAGAWALENVRLFEREIVPNGCAWPASRRSDPRTRRRIRADVDLHVGRGLRGPPVNELTVRRIYLG